MPLPKALTEFKWRWFFQTIAGITVFVVFVLIIFVSPLNHPLYEMVLFHPERLATTFVMPNCEGVAAQEIVLKRSNGKNLVGWYFKQPRSKWVVLFSHGNGGNVLGRFDNLQLLMRTGVSVFAYDYEGYGKSMGKPSVVKICDDAIDAYNYVNKDLGYSPERIVLFGESLGTVVTGHLSANVKSAGIILQSPLFSLPRRGREILPALAIYPDWLYPCGGLDNSLVFKKPHAPLLVVAGTKDQMLPLAHAEDLFASASEPKTFVRIQGAGHTGDPKLTFAPEYAAALKVFFDHLESKTNARSAAPSRLQPTL